jgi:phage head maturation protease
LADVDETSWDGAAAMSAATNSDDPAAAYKAICAGRRDGDPAVQSSWALPHHKSPGDPPNADGTRNALSRLPQTQGLTNRSEAESHLQAHMDAIQAYESRDESDKEMATTSFDDADLQVRSVDRRELLARIVPFDEVGQTPIGPELFKRGAFSHVDPKKVVLTLGHRGAFGPPVGRGIDLEERDDGAYMTFKVSKTQHGDEVLQLAADGVTQGVSVVYHLPTSQGEFQYRDGKRATAWNRVDLREVATTW